MPRREGATKECSDATAMRVGPLAARPVGAEPRKPISGRKKKKSGAPKEATHRVKGGRQMPGRSGVFLRPRAGQKT